MIPLALLLVGLLAFTIGYVLGCAMSAPPSDRSDD